MQTATRQPGFTLATQLERWSNAERVLDTMPEAVREHEWDMGTFGRKTDCGTVACAAGHCGLDPWFRRRGFKLDFNRSGEGEISDVEEFFGVEGALRIFYNQQPRSVDQVLSEVRDYHRQLQRVVELSTLAGLPKIGAEWPEQGGVFGGAFLGEGEADYYLIIGPEHDEPLTWHQANTAASSLRVGEHADYSLLWRREGHAVFDRVGHLFKPAWYWLSDTYASNAYTAWSQGFGYGSQGYWSKDFSSRARLVRRLPIHSFNNLVRGAKRRVRS